MESESLAEARLRHQLDVQSHQINRVMSHHRIPATVTGGEVNSRIIRFDFQTQLTAGWERIRGLSQDFKAALGAGSATLANESGRWQLQVEREPEPPVSLLRILSSTTNLPLSTAVVGMADGGQPVLLQFSPRNLTHVLVTGDIGAGKTSLLRSIGVGLAMTNRQSALQLVVIDPTGHTEQKAVSLRPLAYLPHVLTDPALDHGNAASVLHFLVDEMEYRRQQRIRQPRIIVLIDHIVTLLGHDPIINQDVIRLLQYGPQAGMHLVMATGQPDASILGPSFRSNLSLRVVGKLAQNPSAANQVAGVTVDQAGSLYGCGDFLAVGGEKVTYFQAAYLSDYDLHLVLTQLNRPSPQKLLARPFNPRFRIELEKRSDNTGTPQSFSVREGAVNFDPPDDDIPFTLDG